MVRWDLNECLSDLSGRRAAKSHILQPFFWVFCASGCISFMCFLGFITLRGILDLGNKA